MATAHLPWRRARSRSTSSIGVLRSASLKTRCSPLARSMPRRTAAPLPVFCSSVSTCNCGHSSAMVRDMATVPSLLPSSTIRTSYGSSRPSRYARILTSVAGSRCCSLYAGTMMLSIAGSPSRTLRCGLAALEPPVHGEHRLASKAPGLDRQAPRPFKTDATDKGGRTAHPAGEEVEGATDADARGGADRPEVTIQEELLTASAE